MTVDENILVEVSPGESRAAFVDGQNHLRELIVERMSRPNLVEGIYLGRVLNIEKGIGAAFVDVGLSDTAFLDRASGLHEGEAILVQIVRGAAAGKGPTVRQRVVLPGRYLAYAPGGEGIDWPRGFGGGRRRDSAERAIKSIARDGEGWSVRTRANLIDPEDVYPDVFGREAESLRDQWVEVETAARQAVVPSCLRPAPGLVERLLRGRLGTGTLVVDDRNQFLAGRKLVSASMSDLSDAVAFHERDQPIFEVDGIEDQIAAALERRVGLGRGGALMIDTTEALTVIDVDMGSAGARRRNEDAVLSLNLAAAEAVAREIRLRNISGLIVVDFLTMRGKSPKQKLVEVQRRAFRDSPVPVDVLGITPAGLLEITRRRDGPTLGEMMLHGAPEATQLSHESIACAALRAALRTRGAGKLSLVAGSDIADTLRGPLAAAFEDTVRRMGGALELEVVPSEQSFHIVINRTGK